MFLIAIPEKSVVKKIFELRKKVVELGYASNDPRKNVLPHITLTYIENNNLPKDQISTIKSRLSEMVFDKSIILTVKKFLDWDHKIVALFETQPTKELRLTSQTLFQKMGVKVNKNYQKLYGDTVGDHMKILRQISLKSIQGTIELAKSVLPDKIIIDRIAFIGHGCEEKDILWQKRLTI